ncbi:MAG TPA: hypothetical protein VGV87_30875, partial [Blastocatellia bacterium]|nr:hypothetical protein [Blastocatellia bacterium]
MNDFFQYSAAARSTGALDACEITDDPFFLLGVMKSLPRFILYVLLSILIITFSKPVFACVCR